MNPPDQPGVLRIKKYPNRRFYDATRSRHVTLEDLYRLVRAGREIAVTDAEGNDITNVVLTQIILEHDPPKLDLFPATLLHQAIQANQDMIRSFIDQYFSKAMDAFLVSRKQFETFLAQAGFNPLQQVSSFDWAKRFIGGLESPKSAGPPPGPGPDAARPPETASAEAVAALRGEVAALRAELDRMRGSVGPRALPRPREPRRRR